MSSITGRANFSLTTSTGGGIQISVKKPGVARFLLKNIAFHKTDKTLVPISGKETYKAFGL